MKYSETNKPIVCMQTQSTCYKGTTTGRAVGILWHETNGGNPYISRYVQPSDNDPNKDQLIAILGKNKNGNDWNHVVRSAGLNYWVGKLTDESVSAVQSMPDNYRPWGCGRGSKGSCNGDAGVENSPFWIQFEICDDGYKDKAYFEKAYREACELTAYLCKEHNINPNGTVQYKGVTVPTILCHYDSAKLKLGEEHSDIYSWFNKYNKNMNTVRADVAAIIAESEKPVDPPAQHMFAQGDVVKITGTKYYSGGNVPAWVLKKEWVVKSAKGDRIVLGKSLDGSTTLDSPFHACDLELADSDALADVVETGDLVKITGTKYYSGASVPQWVLNKNWYVHSAQIGNDRIVLNKSENGKTQLMSPFNRKDLKVVKKH